METAPLNTLERPFQNFSEVIHLKTNRRARRGRSGQRPVPPRWGQRQGRRRRQCMPEIRAVLQLLATTTERKMNLWWKMPDVEVKSSHVDVHDDYPAQRLHLSVFGSPTLQIGHCPQTSLHIGRRGGSKTACDSALDNGLCTSCALAVSHPSCSRAILVP